MLGLQNLLLFAGCATFPLYLLPSGGVQIPHLFIFGAAFLAVLNQNVRLSPAAVLLLALTGLSFFREAIAILDGAPISGVLQAAFIAFNLATVVAVQTSLANSRSTECYSWGIPAAALVAFVGLLATGVQLTGDRIEQRAIGTFQNPNQLAYFATILFSITVLLYTFERISGRTVLVLLAGCAILVSASHSKSGIVGVLFGMAMLSIGTIPGRFIAAGLLGVLLVFGYFGAVDFEKLLFIQRLQDIGADRDDSLAARGYLVLLENARQPLEVWFGLGADGVRKANGGHEIHSTYVAYFGLYGFVGGLLYLGFLWSWTWTMFVNLSLTRFFAIVAPPLLFGIAHNGTRFSIFYVLVALSLGLCESQRPAARVFRQGAGAR